MEPHIDHDDEALLADLGSALAGSRRPLADQVVVGGRAAFTFLTMEEELAGLVYDSLLEAEPVGHGRAPVAARTVVFESETVSVQMEITQDGIVGQVVPIAGAKVSAEAADGRRTEVVTDEVGCFALPTPSHGPMRLYVATSGATTVTEWTHFDTLSESGQ
jgi:hypothetical protein